MSNKLTKNDSMHVKKCDSDLNHEIEQTLSNIYSRSL